MLSLKSNVDFMIHGLFSYKLFGQTFWITTTHVSILIISLTLIVLAIIVRIKLKPYNETPGTLQTIAEMAVEFVDNTAYGAMNKYAPKYLNYIGTLFLFILCSNISGLVGLRPPTADYGTTLILGIISFFLIQFAAWRYNAKGSFKGLFEPIFLFLPVNLISEIATPISLSLRLFGNVVSGTVIMGLLYGLLPVIATSWGIPSFLHVYFDIFSGAIQTYVFCMLTMTFTRNKYPD